MKLPEITIQVKYKNSTEEKIIIDGAPKVVEVAQKIFNSDTIAWTEEVLMLCLSRRNELVGYYKVSSGGMSASIIDPKVVFTIALNSCAHGIIMLHNHPSGNLKPSEQDDLITKRLRDSGKILDIKLLDHIIIVPDGKYYSYANESSIL